MEELGLLFRRGAECRSELEHQIGELFEVGRVEPDSVVVLNDAVLAAGVESRRADDVVGVAALFLAPGSVRVCSNSGMARPRAPAVR